MSALRQQEYQQYAQALDFGAPGALNSAQRQTSISKKTKTPKTILKTVVDRMLTFVLVLCVVAVAVAGCTYILKRYVEIHRTQVEIFNIRQDIKQLDKTRDELLVQKESEMTLEELETYAIDYLGMVKASEGYKVVVAQNYRVVSQDLIQPTSLVAEETPKPTDDPLVALGAWFKRLASF